MKRLEKMTTILINEYREQINSLTEKAAGDTSRYKESELNEMIDRIPVLTENLAVLKESRQQLNNHLLKHN